MKDLNKRLQEMMLNDCNNKIDNFNEISNYLTQYSTATVYLIPKKYLKTVTNELDNLINTYHTPVVYEVNPADDDDYITLTLFNFGVMQRENLLKELKEK